MDGKSFSTILNPNFECYHIRRIAWTSQRNLEARQSQMTIEQTGTVVDEDKILIEVVMLELECFLVLCT